MPKNIPLVSFFCINTIQYRANRRARKAALKATLPRAVDLFSELLLINVPTQKRPTPDHYAPLLMPIFIAWNLAGAQTMDHDYLRRNYLEIGLKLCKEGNWAKSAQLLEAGLDECERVGLQDLLSAAILCNLAVVNQKLGNSETIERYLLKSLSISRSFFDETHPSVVAISRLLAKHYYECGRLSEAGQFYKRALAGASLKKEDRVDCLIRLAAIENAHHRRARAEALCREVCELRYGG